MTNSTSPLPVARADLVIRQIREGEYVVKNPADAKYFRLEADSVFLLEGLDGRQTAAKLCEAYRRRFGEDLSEDELQAFLKSARSHKLVDDAPPEDQPATAAAAEPAPDATPPLRKKVRGSLLFLRVPICRPDRFLTWLEPKVRFLWTPLFVALSVGAAAVAALVVLTNQQQLADSFYRAVRWETVVVAWFLLFLATVLHECAHGLTCKHFGGDVPDAGFLLMMFMPCFYCNVSDAWLMPRKQHRLWTTFSGAFSDLCVWAASVFVWRVTVLDSTVNYFAFVLASVCGTRTLLNINPFLRLDGYYLLSDALSIPNLRPRAQKYLMENVRWLLWGAERPQPVENGRLLIAYGLLIWLAAVLFLDFMIVNIWKFLGGGASWLAFGAAMLLLYVGFKRVFKGFFASEASKMIRIRRKRTVIWCLCLFGLPLAMACIPVDNATTGQFQVRPTVRCDVPAPAEGFIAVVHVRQGDHVAKGDRLVELRSPALDSQILQKQAEVRETKAKLAKLKMGPRTELMDEQKKRISRAQSWLDLAHEDLKQAKATLKDELLRLDLEIQQVETELEFARESLENSKRLYALGALAGEQLRVEKKQLLLLQARRKQAQARRQIRATQGVREKEAEVKLRKQQLEEVKATMVLLKAGTQIQEIQAEQAHLDRLNEELRYLIRQKEKFVVVAPVSGVVVTPRLREKTGQLAPKGSLLCAIEDTRSVQVEIVIPEENVTGLQKHQPISLKARSLPFETFFAELDRIAPSATTETPPAKTAATKPNPQSTVTVLCRVNNQSGRLKSGMTGNARILRGSQRLGAKLLNQGMRYLRTEFWW